MQGAARLEPLGALCAVAVSGAEAVAAGACAATLVPQGNSIDSEDALACVARLIEVEHMADDTERAVTRAVFRGTSDVRTALPVLDLARALERATDRMAEFGHLLYGHVLRLLSA